MAGEYPNGRNSGVKFGKLSDTSDKRPRSDRQPLARSRLIHTDPAGDPGFELASEGLWKHIAEAGEGLNEFITRHREQLS